MEVEVRWHAAGDEDRAGRPEREPALELAHDAARGAECHAQPDFGLPRAHRVCDNCGYYGFQKGSDKKGMEVFRKDDF